MRIGVVMPAFNVAPYIATAIGSVLAQTHRDWRLTIVDDGSTDGTANIVMGALGDRRIRLFRQANAGVSVARNRGLAETPAEAILLLDADDWLAPDALVRLAAELAANPDAAAVAAPYARVDEAGVPIERVRRAPSGDLRDALLTRNLFVNGGHLLIRRPALDRAGGFDPALRYGEDWELWTRLAYQGPFVAVPGRRPLLFARERQDGAYLAMAARRSAFVPCMDAIFASPLHGARLGRSAMDRLRAKAQAENDWIVGRELIRHGRAEQGRRYLVRSVLAAPGPKRLLLLAICLLPAPRLGPFRRYPARPAA